MIPQNENGNDNDNIVFDHNIHIKITIYTILENQIINWSGQPPPSPPPKKRQHKRSPMKDQQMEGPPRRLKRKSPTRE